VIKTQKKKKKKKDNREERNHNYKSKQKIMFALRKKASTDT